MSEDLTPGTEVLVRALKRRGTILGVVRPGVYRVLMGALTSTVRGNDLEPVQPKRKARVPSASSFSPTGETPVEAAQLATVDLHGLTVDEARNKVVGHISRAILAGLERIEIIHGIGTGRLKAAITADLRRISAVRAVKPHPSNPGVTVAYL